MNWHRFSYFALGLTFFWILLTSFWQFYPYNPVDVFNKPYPILNEGKQVSKGDTVRWLAKWCKNTDKNAQVKIELVNIIEDDGFNIIGEYPVQELVSQSTKGCNEKEFNFLVVPNYLPSGYYFVKLTSDYKVNPIRTVSVVSETEFFEVK